jgi:4-hydroxybenzoate polyprenyltransferase
VPAVLSFYLLFLVIWSWATMPVPPTMAWMLGVVAATAQVVWHATLIRTRSREGCFKAFRANHWVGFALFAGLGLG